MNNLDYSNYFATPIYAVKKEEFLEPVKNVSNFFLKKAKNNFKDQQVTLMTEDYSNEPSIFEFSQFVSQTAWNILESQGYAMDNLVTFFTEMWTQEHNYLSSMDTHIHGLGTKISAFFFLDVPKDGCSLVIHDPRPAKVITDLPFATNEKVSHAASQIAFTPEEGTIIFTPSWIPHSFTRNLSFDPTRFVHMNLSVAETPKKNNVEVI